MAQMTGKKGAGMTEKKVPMQKKWPAPTPVTGKASGLRGMKAKC